MALTETYVDPAIAGNSGTGTSVDPYGDLQYALNTMTRDGTNGDRLNIKAGTAEVMASAISLATYGTPTAAAPLVFQGYTSAAGDGGIGEINNGGANVSVIDASTTDYVSFYDMKIGNTGTASVVRLRNHCAFINVDAHSTSNANGILHLTSFCLVARCKLYSGGATGVQFVSGSSAAINCSFSGSFSTAAIDTGSGGMFVSRNVFSLTSGGIGMRLRFTYTNCVIDGNSFYAVSGTGRGISNAGTTGPMNTITNNIFTGFSGVGGTAIVGVSGHKILLFGKNAFYNNTADKSNVDPMLDLGDITLTNAPFTNPGSGDFSIASAAKAELQAQGWPSSFNGISTSQYLDPGAAQIEIPTSTGGGRRSRGRYHGV